MKNILFAVIALVISLGTVSCVKYKDQDPAPGVGQLNFGFTSAINGGDFDLNTYYPINNGADSITASTFKFFVTNVQLRKKSDGTYFNIPNSYYLFDQANEDPAARVAHYNTFHIPNVVAGEYDQIRFLVGLDSATNFATVVPDIDALNRNNNIYWSWSSGYKFLMFEGKSKQKSGSTELSQVFHAGSDSNKKWITFDLPTTSVISNGGSSTIKVVANVEKVFTGTTNFDMRAQNNVMMGTGAANLANNYASMFTLTSVTNEVPAN